MAQFWKDEDDEDEDGRRRRIWRRVRLHLTHVYTSTKRGPDLLQEYRAVFDAVDPAESRGRTRRSAIG